ncbi:mas-related G-protein coupled receptor member H-like [Ornithorhynchus anatinus]|uniref:mas-related G-protein coupled receptor member H-like n=1 Tax=Ornithorhynchus anatinus TaxID=9258 RepID=UPI0010A7C3F9|nr:mas-related G-protein coupled receptor member H-like [Ornithorhynchus anatinus]
MKPKTCTPSNLTTSTQDATFHLVVDSVSLLLSLAGLAGNSLVLWFLGLRFKQNPFTVYILHLAGADFCFLLGRAVWFGTNIVYRGLKLNAFRKGVFYLCHATLVFNIFMFNTSLGLLTAISVERGLSVLFPLWYRRHRWKNRPPTLCAVLWVLSALTATLEFYFCVYQAEAQEAHWLGNASVRLVSCVLSFLISTPLMVLSGVVLFAKLRRRGRDLPPAKSCIVVIAAVLTFLAFGLPQRVWFVVKFEFKVYVSRPVSSVVQLLSCMNSSANPIIYFFVGNFRKGRGRRSVRLAFLKAFKEDHHLQEEGEVTSRAP